MATDIRQLLLTSQEVIDNAVATVTSTTKTEETLQKNIQITDKKIGIHNVDIESHEDIRVKLGDIPSMLTDPEIKGPSASETGMENEWTFLGSCIFPSLKVIKFIVTCEDGTTEEIPVENPDMTATVKWKHTFVGARNSTTSFTVQAVSDYTYTSNRSTKEILITKHLPPVMDGLTHTLPERVSYGKSYKFKVDGITDPDGDLVGYNLSANTPKVTFSQDTKCIQGLQYTMNIASDYKGPNEDLVVTIEAIDEWDFTNSHAVHIAVNSDPTLGTLVHNLPKCLNPGQKYTCRLSGVADPDGDDLTFDAASTLGKITFSKTTGIGQNEDFIITVANDATAGSAYTLNFTFKDPYGGSSVRSISSKINTPPSVTNFVCTKPTAFLKHEPNTISFAGATDADGEAVTYNIVNTNSCLHFNKVTNLTNNEQVEVTLTNDAVRGNTYTITVEAVDASGGKSTVSVPIKVNHLPSESSLAHNIPAIVKPGTTYSFKFTTTVDSDNQALRYTVTCDNDDIVITGAEDIAGNVNFSLTTPPEAKLARGSFFTLTVAVTDGLETDELVIRPQINKLPVASNVTHTFPTKLYGGSENARTGILKTGATEPDSQTFTYTIVADSGITVSKTSSIAANTTLTFTATKVTAQTTKHVKIYAVDALGERSTTYTDVTITVYPIEVTATPAITGVTNNSTTVARAFTMNFSAYSKTYDTGTGAFSFKSTNPFALGVQFGTNRVSPAINAAGGPNNCAFGMTQAQANTLYTGTRLAGQVTIISGGLQKVTIAEAGYYTFVCRGAQGGSSGYLIVGSAIDTAGGRPAIMKGTMYLAANTVLYILVGQVGWCNDNTNYGGGGGGASAIFRANTSGAYTLTSANAKVDVLMVAGGGAGRFDESRNRDYNIMDDTCVMNAVLTNGTSTAAGSASGAGSGAGLNTAGGKGSANYAAPALIAGTGMVSSATNYCGGYGGGGSPYNGGGGGGGYSGGASSDTWPSYGGTSFVNASMSSVSRKLATYNIGDPMMQGAVWIYAEYQQNRANMVPA